jgi:hypothetical protein
MIELTAFQAQSKHQLASPYLQPTHGIGCSPVSEIIACCRAQSSIESTSSIWGVNITSHLLDFAERLL